MQELIGMLIGKKRKQYKSLDPSARVRYLAKLLVLEPKEADDPFAAWNDRKFEDR